MSLKTEKMSLTTQEQGWLDEFAQAALPALVDGLWDDHDYTHVAKHAYSLALDMIEERRKVQRKHNR